MGPQKLLVTLKVIIFNELIRENMTWLFGVIRVEIMWRKIVAKQSSPNCRSFCNKGFLKDCCEMNMPGGSFKFSRVKLNVALSILTISFCVTIFHNFYIKLEDLVSLEIYTFLSVENPSFIFLMSYLFSGFYVHILYVW